MLEGLNTLFYIYLFKFFTKALKIKNIDEPFASLFTQGMVCHNTYQNRSKAWVYPEDLEKKGIDFTKSLLEKKKEGPIESMSKSKNVIDPQSIIDSYGETPPDGSCL